MITIMVLEMQVPHGTEFSDLRPLAGVFLSYVLSFVNVGIDWNNHHHMLYTVKHVDAGILWANLHLLSWLSIMPFTTGWMAESHFAPLPTALYGVVLMLSAVAYIILQRAIIVSHSNESALAKAIGRDIERKISAGIYVFAVPTVFFRYCGARSVCVGRVDLAIAGSAHREGAGAGIALHRFSRGVGKNGYPAL